MSVHWNEGTDNVVIDKYLFQSEVLCCKGSDKIFESNSLKTFICLMNFYGFIKICPTFKETSLSSKSILKHLVPTSSKEKEAAEPKKTLLRDSPQGRQQRIQPKGPEESPGCLGTQKHLVIQVFGSIVHEQTVPGESSAQVSQVAQVGRAHNHDTGVLSTRPPNYPLYHSVMCLYDTCYSLLMAALSVMSPLKEEEDSSDYKSVFCEPVKDNIAIGASTSSGCQHSQCRQLVQVAAAAPITPPKKGEVENP
ncbi:hypothetical protein QTO34_000559 [Cnephaeus nilssonii]|uniref:HSF-type DNA-binding domain-containing protein n=1 Tax=Cnephaeus nilssonii TaxID=3371016 RepID=A0AA40IBN0_CNENI|nr:hypothetical protein QTO34_000559 [Eptesicus nilssonii]